MKSITKAVALTAAAVLAGTVFAGSANAANPADPTAPAVEAPSEQEYTAAATLPCRGGSVTLRKPWRSGPHILTSSTIVCASDTAPLNRIGYVDVRLDQYRGLGIWRNKANEKISIRNAAIRTTLTPSWRCSGGNQLYRNHTEGYVKEGLAGPKEFSHKSEKRLTC
ncbi:hypothetical protein [Rhizohabitans arisaemae]|uniref:hypothetical protein n=1 Tax=Rhizohabitans arisaemae TaxID=2720610 RepID=UPI0024B1A491|nr:hypothetical protein [Rhizohabitans arisaemae]